MSLHIQNISRSFGTFRALDNVSLDVPTGGLIALLGPSGSGKTTLLRIIAGLETPDTGVVHAEEEDVTTRPAQERNFGFVFQHYALFRHMSVFENIAFALRVRSWKQKAVEERVRELLHLVRLDGLGQRLPSQLSGGQRQRVALARALAARPRLLLLDEPFGALDARVRLELRQWLRNLHDEMQVTTIFVTHDQEEAFSVADRVVLMNQGRIEQVGTPEEVFENPASAFVMDFLGNVNVFRGRARSGIADLGGWNVHVPDYAHADDRPVRAFIRPHELEIVRTHDASTLPARVVHLHRSGALTRVHLQRLDDDSPLLVELSPSLRDDLRLSPGEVIGVTARKVRVFEPEDYCI